MHNRYSKHRGEKIRVLNRFQVAKMKDLVHEADPQPTSPSVKWQMYSPRIKNEKSTRKVGVHRDKKREDTQILCIFSCFFVGTFPGSL